MNAVAYAQLIFQMLTFTNKISKKIGPTALICLEYKEPHICEDPTTERCNGNVSCKDPPITKKLLSIRLLSNTFCSLTYVYICHICVCLLVLIFMHWQQGSDIESKGDPLSSSAECRIRTQGLWNQISSRLNVRWQTDWAIEDRAIKTQ